MASHDFLQETPRCTSFVDDDENQPLTGSLGKDVLYEFEAESSKKPPKFLTLSYAYALALHLVVVILGFLLFNRPTLNTDIMPLHGRTCCKSCLDLNRSKW